MTPADVEVTVVHGDVPDATKDRARDKIAKLERYAPKPFLFARVRFDRPSTRQRPDPPVHIQVQLDVDGRMVQTSTMADLPDEAVDILESRLREQLRRLTSRLNSIRNEPETVDEGEWRRGALPTRRPDHFPRPRSDRQLVWRETFAREPMRPDEAAFDLEMLDYEFHLFVELDSGADAVIHHMPDRNEVSFGLVVAGEVTLDVADLAVPVHLGPSPPALDIDDAVRRLEAGEEPFVFFVNTATGRGTVVHMRYDGHVGLVVPQGTLGDVQGAVTT